jgi:hypothetical protein
MATVCSVMEALYGVIRTLLHNISVTENLKNILNFVRTDNQHFAGGPIERVYFWRCNRGLHSLCKTFGL